MSNSLFKDTVTLYHRVVLEDGEAIYRRVLKRTKYIETFKIEGESSVVLYIPLGVKRGLKYLPPSEFPETAHLGSTFSVSVGDKVVPGICRGELPPEDAYTITVIENNFFGTIRMHHIKAKGAIIIPPAEEDALQNEDEGGMSET